jgi:hypothetical protein
MHLLAVTIISQTKFNCTAARVRTKKSEIISTVLNSKSQSLNLSLTETPDSSGQRAALLMPSTKVTQ